MKNTGTCYPGLGWICQVHMGFGLSASAKVPDKPVSAWVASPGILQRSQLVYHFIPTQAAHWQHIQNVSTKTRYVLFLNRR